MENQENSVQVTVIVISYNQVKYIREALEGLVNQQTNFTFELIVHDDASSDGTQAIIQEFYEKYPKLIVPILQAENQYSKKTNILEDYVIPQCRGQYIAFCECDDRWIDMKKLQKQFDVLNQREDCSICVHEVRTIDTEGNRKEETFPPQNLLKSNQIMSTNEFLKYDRYLFQTSSYFLRKSVFLKNKDLAYKLSSFLNGDECWLRVAISEGSIYYISECMSEYRLGVEGSWSTKYQEEGNKAYINLLKNTIKGDILFDQLTNQRFRNVLIEKCFRNLSVLTYHNQKEAQSILKENYSVFKKEMGQLTIKNRIKYYLLLASPKIVSLFMK